MLSSSTKLIAGVDEVGRGSLFGPVFAGAVVLNELAGQNLKKAGLKDSKKLSPKLRSHLVPIIKETAIAWALGQASAREVDNFGIRLATEKAMVRALQRIPMKLAMVLVDGLHPIKIWPGEQKALVRGDSYSPSIAAASVLAKEERDALIKRLASRYPKYGLEKHVGYGTKFHIAALRKLGSSELHRQSFLSKILYQKIA